MSSLLGAFDFPYFFSLQKPLIVPRIGLTVLCHAIPLFPKGSIRVCWYKMLGRSKSGGGGGSYFPYILLNEIQTMFSQLAKRSASVLPADLCTDHAHYVKIHRSTVLRRNKNMAVEGGTVSHYYILVIRNFIDFMSLFRHSVWFSFSVKQFPFAEFGICNI